MTREPEQFFVVGGTLGGDVASYVERQADRDLLEALSLGEFCYVLDTRQVGKSSLMVRTAARLRSLGRTVGVLDISGIGQNVSIEQWYFGLLSNLAVQFGLETEVETFWSSQSGLGCAQRWFACLYRVILPRLPTPLVLFADEIDAVKRLPFSVDEFFTLIRECHNRRAYDSTQLGAAFCMLGVAQPSELITDTRTTPFNIGKRIILRDLQLPEMQSLKAGLRGDSSEREAQIARIWHWTGGHPFLTQKLCHAVAESTGPQTTQEVDRLCNGLFLTAEAKAQEDNLRFVSGRLLDEGEQRSDILSSYRRILVRKRIRDDAADPILNHLRLTGIVATDTRRDSVSLSVRNRIYGRVFDRRWIRDNLPDADLRRQRRALYIGFARASVIWAAIVALVTYGGLQNYQALWIASEKNREKQSMQKQVEAAGIRAARMEARAERATADLAAAIANKRSIDAKSKSLEKALSSQQSAFGSIQRKTAGLKQDMGRLAQEKSKLQFENGAMSGPIASAFASQRGEELKALELGLKGVEGPHGADPSRLAVQGIVDAVDVGILRKACLHHPGGVAYAAFNRTGTRLITCGHSRFAYIWETDTFKVIQRIEVLRPGAAYPVVNFAAFTDNDEWIITASDAGGVCIWNGADHAPILKKPLLVLPERAEHDNMAALATDLAYEARPGKLAPLLVTTGLKNTALVWDLKRPWNAKTMVPIRLLGHTKYIWSVAISTEHRYVATGSEDGTAKVWDGHTGRLLYTCASHSGPVYSVKFNVEENLVASAGSDGSVKLWHFLDNPDHHILAEYPGHVGSVREVAIGGRDDWLASSGDDSTVRLWSFRPSPNPIHVLHTHAGTVWSIRFSSDGRQLVTVSGDGTADIWKLTLPTYASMGGNILSTHFSKDGKYILCTSSGQYADIWDWQHNLHAAHLDVNHWECNDACFVDSLQQVVTASANGGLDFWRIGALEARPNHIRQEKAAHTEPTNHGPLNSVVLSNDGTCLVTSGDDHTAKLWSLSTEKLLRTLVGHKAEVKTAAFCRDGSRVVTASNDGSLCIWDVRSGAILQRLQVPAHRSEANDTVESWPIAALFSPDDRLIAAAASDKCGYVWEARNNRQPAILKGHTGKLTGIAYSPDGSQVATASEDRTVCVWLARDIRPAAVVRPYYVLRCFASTVRCVAFSPDGKWLAAAGDDGIGHVYPASLEGYIQKAQELYQKPLMQRDTADFPIFADTK